MLRQDGHAHTEHQSKLPWCETSEEGLLSFALLASEWTQNAKVIIDPMLFMSKQKVQIMKRASLRSHALSSCTSIFFQSFTRCDADTR